MTRNPVDDNTVPRAAEFNAIANGPSLEGIDSGCTPTKGTGDWDVDVASGTVRIGTTTASVSAQTETLTDPANDADMDSGESRIDLVHIDSNGTVNSTEGTAASNPASPDIPTDEALVAAVIISDSDSTIADSTLRDARVILAQPEASALAETSWAPAIGVGSVEQTDGSSATAEIFYDSCELRSPGEASATDQSRVYNTAVGFDPSESWTVRLNLANITIDNNNDAIITLSLTDSPNGDVNTGADFVTLRLQGDGEIEVRTSNDSTSNSATDTSQDNSFAAGANYIQLSLDGSTATGEVSDGSATVTVSSSTNYPSGSTLFLRIAAEDQDGANARNSDFDGTQLRVTPP